MFLVSAFFAVVLPVLPPSMPDLGLDPAAFTRMAAGDGSVIRYRGIEALFAKFSRG